MRHQLPAEPCGQTLERMNCTLLWGWCWCFMPYKGVVNGLWEVLRSCTQRSKKSAIVALNQPIRLREVRGGFYPYQVVYKHLQ